MDKNFVDITRAYVVVDESGTWISRPFGSAKAALKSAGRREDGYFTVIEITTCTSAFGDKNWD